MPDEPRQPASETDERFPSGPWRGFYIQWGMRGRQRLALSFADGLVSGSGSDPGGDFVVRGTYDKDAGKVALRKVYTYHVVEYDGHAEGDGIWGGWVIRAVGYSDHGGFHIWPDAQGQAESQHAQAEEPEPAFA